MHTNKLFPAISAVAIAFLIACSGGGTDPGTTVDASASGLETTCGHPGDPGNALGVGKYCNAIADCSGLTAGICAILGDPNAHFCTKTCMKGSTDACGSEATCACQGSQCGCVPNACLQ
jgi:hypothetical protein